MVDVEHLTRGIVLDAAPLIYLAKLEALDVLEVFAEVLTPPQVVQEVTRPAVAYRHPDAVLIERALARGLIQQVELAEGELEDARSIERRIAGLHRGECEVLAIARSREMPAVIFERPARRVARALGIQLVDTVELLFAGTTERVLLALRVRGFARLTQMRLSDLEALLKRLERRRP